MAGRLAGKRILVVEDEYFIAADIRSALQDEGAEVLGPVGALARGFELTSERADAAVLDVNLAGESSYPLAGKLLGDDVPVLFVTGYDSWSMPEEFREYPRVSKPFPMDSVVDAVVGLIIRNQK